jgi:hypothetical protein
MQEETTPIWTDRTPLFPGKSCYPLSWDYSNDLKQSQEKNKFISKVLWDNPKGPDYSGMYIYDICMIYMYIYIFMYIYVYICRYTYIDINMYIYMYVYV